MKHYRRLRNLLITIAVFFLPLLFLLYSETGLRWGVLLLTDVLAKPLTINEFHGRLAGPFTLSGIEYKDSLHRLSLKQLTLDWKPARLFTATAHVTQLHAYDLQYSQLQKNNVPPKPSEKITLPQIGFPLKLVIDDARLDGMKVRFSAQTEPLTVKQLSLQAETRLNTLQVHTLRMDSDWLTLVVSGDIRPRQDYQVALELEWSLPQQDKHPWQGKGTLKGNITSLNLQQRLTSPFVATLALEAGNLLDELSWKGRLEIPQLKSSQLPFSVSPSFSLGGVLTANGKLDSFSSTTHFAGLVDTIGNIEGNLDATYLNRQIQFTRFLLLRQEDSARMEASGNIELTTPLRYRVQARWDALTWPLDSHLFTSKNGQLNVSGEDRQYQFSSDFLLSGEQLPPGQWQMQGEGSDKSVTVSTFEGKLLDGTISGKGTVNFTPRLHWQGQLQGKGLNPAVMWPQWPGALAFSAEVSGQQTDKELAVAFSLPELSGTLRGRKLQGSSEAEWRGSIASLKVLDLQSGSAKLRAKGQLTDKVTFDWQLKAADLGDLLPQAQGSITSEGNISGPVKTPRLALRVDGSQLLFDSYQTKKIQADIIFNLQPHAPSSLDLQLEQMQLPGFQQLSLSLKGRGSLSEHRISLDIHDASQNLNMDLNARYADGHWAGMINRLQIDDEQLGQWKIAQATGFSITADAMNLNELCLRQGSASLCSQAKWVVDSSLSTDLRSSRFPLELLKPYLPQRFSFTGELDGKANFELFPQRSPRLEADLTIGQGRLAMINPDTGIADLSLPYRNASLKIDTSAKGLSNSVLKLTLAEQDSILISMQTSLSRGWPERPLQHPMKGRLNASIADLGFVSSVIPEVQNFHGAVDVDIQFSGTLKSPRLNGYARLVEGRMDIPRLGLKLSALHVAASGNNAMKMEISGGVRSGDGELSLSGQLAPTDKGKWGIDLALNGKNFEVAHIPEARGQISPDLTARIVGREIRLRGKIDVPMARLEPPNITLAIKPSDDVIIVNRDEEEPQGERWLIYTNIRMTAADTIRFIGYGFDGRIGGNLLLVDEPGSFTRGRGQLHVVPGSTYKTFGTKLSTEHGQLNFADSPIDNPNLDIRAVRKVGDVIAGINIRGTAKKPLLTLYSEPPMDQADILSYITLGRPMSTARQSEGAELAGAANTAGLIGGNYLAGIIGREFGLEEAYVEAEPTTQSPWVVVGTYLSPRLYVRYGVGVYESVYSIIVRYQLSEHWQVQGEGGTNSGADILYTFER